MSKQNRGCFDKMSEVNFSPAEILWEDENFDAQAANLCIKPRIFMRRMTQETI